MSMVSAALPVVTKMAAYTLTPLSRRLVELQPRILKHFTANYSLKKLGLGKASAKAGQIMEKRVLPVETDPCKLVNYVCGSNIYKEGEDLELKKKSDYPEWLWTLRLERRPISLDEMDRNTIEYWRRLNKLNKKRNAEFLRVKKPK